MIAGCHASDRHPWGGSRPCELQAQHRGEHAPGSMIEQMTDLSDATKQRLLASTLLEFLGIDEAVFRYDDARGEARKDRHQRCNRWKLSVTIIAMAQTCSRMWW